MKLTSRERILKAARHQETDRVPIDLGGTDCSTIAIGPYRRLCESFGIDAAPYHIVDISQQIVIVDDRVADRLGADAKVIWHLPAQWRDDHAYDRTPIKYPARFRPITLDNGDKVILDKDGKACLRMPDSGFYYDICNHLLEPVQYYRGRSSGKHFSRVSHGKIAWNLNLYEVRSPRLTKGNPYRLEEVSAGRDLKLVKAMRLLAKSSFDSDRFPIYRSCSIYLLGLLRGLQR